MKNFLLTMIFAGIFIACDTTTKHLGEQFTLKKPVSVDEVLKQVKTTAVLNDIQIEGVIAKSCMTEGCWFTIKDQNGAEILFDVKDKKFKVPTNSPGKTAILLADVAADSTSEQKVAILVKGLMFK